MLVDGCTLTLEDVEAVARRHHPVMLDATALLRVERARSFVEQLVQEGRVVYGVTTGFGKFSEVVIPPEQVRALQRNLLRSHACGVGPELGEEVVRAMLLLRLNALMKGYSGVRPRLCHLLTEMLNRGVQPVVPSQGSVGASGDLVPLAHLALVCQGEGEAFFQGRRLPGREALALAGLEPLELEAKEGLALINGTQAMTAIGCLVALDGGRLAQVADVAAAMSLEALRGTLSAFSPRLMEVRPHPGQAQVAANVRRICAESQIIASHRFCSRVQDAYSLRCVPQVHGASRDALQHVRQVLEREINAATDNPLLFVDNGEALSGGNFHGQPVALALEYLGMALAELADISERRLERLLNPALSGLPAFLSPHGGLHSGLMISQYTAAALVSENKVLAHPAVVDSIPTSAGQEDHVSMGNISARKAAAIAGNVEAVLAIELIAAAQALDFLAPRRPGLGTRAAWECLRAEIPHLEEDQVLAPWVERARGLIRSGRLLAAVQKAAGPLG
ncbi:MAG: histidine ammonia-lyase [Firmicutes bacterium]|nr:histidine ammonia-lyase [Bacillota bacterium]